MTEDKHKLTIVCPELGFVVKYSYIYNTLLNRVTTIYFSIYTISSVDEKTEEVICHEIPFTEGEIIYTGGMIFKSYSLGFEDYKKVKSFTHLLTEIYYKTAEIFKIEFKETE
jgi:hypothetical protein